MALVSVADQNLFMFHKGFSRPFRYVMGQNNHHIRTLCKILIVKHGTGVRCGKKYVHVPQRVLSAVSVRHGAKQQLPFDLEQRFEAIYYNNSFFFLGTHSTRENSLAVLASLSLSLFLFLSSSLSTLQSWPQKINEGLSNK